MTPLLDHTEILSADLGALSRRRWAAELHRKEIKTEIELEIPRCQSRDLGR
jgi:IS4 transposase